MLRSVIFYCTSQCFREPAAASELASANPPIACPVPCTYLSCVVSSIELVGWTEFCPHPTPDETRDGWKASLSLIKLPTFQLELSMLEFLKIVQSDINRFYDTDLINVRSFDRQVYQVYQKH